MKRAINAIDRSRKLVNPNIPDEEWVIDTILITTLKAPVFITMVFNSKTQDLIAQSSGANNDLTLLKNAILRAKAYVKPTRLINITVDCSFLVLSDQFNKWCTSNHFNLNHQTYSNLVKANKFISTRKFMDAARNV